MFNRRVLIFGLLALVPVITLHEYERHSRNASSLKPQTTSSTSVTALRPTACEP